MMYTTKPKTNENIPPESIESLSLMELKKYACPKVMHLNEWYFQCEDCPGKSGCRVGKRAVEILENETRPDKYDRLEKFNERLHKAAEFPLVGEALKKADDKQKIGDNQNEIKEKRMNHNKAKAMEAVQKYFEGRSYKEAKMALLTENKGIFLKSLSRKLYKWKLTYPELSEKYPILSELMVEWTHCDGHRTVDEELKAITEKEELAMNIIQNENARSEHEIRPDDELDIEEVLKAASFSEEPEDSEDTKEADIHVDGIEKTWFEKKISEIRREIARCQEKIQILNEQEVALHIVSRMVDEDAAASADSKGKKEVSVTNDPD